MTKDFENVDALFPLPLTSIEKFYWYDSSSKFTNQVYGRLRYEGVIDPVVAEAAAKRVIQRHPLLTCKIEKSKGSFSWVQAPDERKQIQWDAKLDESVGPKAIAIDREIPWNVICRNNGKTTEIWFHMSHAVGDGLAGVQIIGDWMKCYHQISSGSDSIKGFHKLNGEDLRKRNHLGLLSSTYLKNLWKQPLGLFGATKFIFRKPAPFLGNSTNEADWDHHAQPAVIGGWVDSNISKDIEDSANSIGVSVNSLVLGSLMQTLEKFCQRNDDRVSPWIRVILPMSIRTFADRRMPATNRATVVQVDRKASDFANDGFFQGLNREIQIIRDWDLGKLFLIFVRAMAVIPSLLKRSANNQKCRGTAVFANLAEPFGRLGLPTDGEKLVVGNLKLFEFDFVGPIRRLMPINFSLQKFLGRYRVSLHFDSRLMTQDQAEELLNAYLERLASFAKASN